MTKKFGTLTYTARAFKQDSEDAMKGDVIRALIELITNADDAYNSKGGFIQIRLRKAEKPFQVIIDVHDRATGLDGDGLEKAFARLGDVNEKFIGNKGTRGLFGRGAKDVAALGKARFISIRNGKFSSLEIDPINAAYSMDNFNDDATLDNFEDCLLLTHESGLTAQLFVSEVHRIPSTADLVNKLQTHVQLRDLLHRNEVLFFDERSNTDLKLVGIQPQGEKIFDKSLDIAKYKQPVRIEIYRLPEKQQSNLDEYSLHGLIVSGRGAAYENSFLHLSKRPEVGWFCGRIDAPEIHDLARSLDTDKSLTDLNPTRIVSRQRDGLVKNHPYFRALASELEKILKPLLDAVAEEEGAQRREGEKLRKRFDALSQILGNALQELLDEADAGDLPASFDDEGTLFSLSFIPPKRLVRVGDSATITLRAPDLMDLQSIETHLEQDSNVFEILGKTQMLWNKHERLPIWQKTFKVSATSRGSAYLVASNQEARTICELISVNFEPFVEVEPESIVFEPEQVKVAPTKSRNIILRGPLNCVGEIVHVTCNSEKMSIQNTAIFKASRSGRSAECTVRLTARNEEGSALIDAKLGKQTCTCKITISESAKNKNPKIKIEIKGNDNPPRRVETVPEEGQLTVRIFARHRSLTQIFGKATETGFELENSPQASATIVEIVAQQLAIYVVERDAELHPDRYQDASRVLFKQQENLTRFVILLQSGLIEN